MADNLGAGDGADGLHALHSLRVDSDASPGDDPQTPSPTGAQIGDDDDMDMDMDLGSLDDVDDMVNADGSYQALSQEDEDGSHDTEAHRHRLGASLAQLPKSRDEDDEASFSATRQATSTFVSASKVSSDNDGFDYFYDSPANSPVAAASSTALVVASSSSTAPLVGPLNAPGRSPGTSPSRSMRNRNPFTGLSNQGATCYMNSLLQTMFMTPELRLGLYRWQFVDDDDEAEEDNIPFQLQKLFANLQLTTEESISTKALTKSFGWTGADVFQQHDVQELCRVLFDALERSFKGTVNETLVNDLYQGTLKDYVKCLDCGYESSRNDEFLDLSLVIRPFGSSQMMKSVEEAIELYLKPEVLNGDNQWRCDQCKTKRDAIKGLKFSKLPYLLSLQLKRFDYDFMTDSRIKLHDRVTFPKYLDMNAYLHGDESNGASRGKIARKLSMERHELEGRGGSGSLQQETLVDGAEQERLRRQELERIEMAKKMQLKFFMKTNIRGKIEKSIYVYKTATLRETLEIAHKAFAEDLNSEMPALKNTRLRSYNDYNGHVSDAYEGKEDKSLQALQMYSSYQLFLESKKDDEEWESFDSSRMQVFVRKFLLPSEANKVNECFLSSSQV
ncbi:hypothetical protein P43SY_008666 [Pythium insidiosum]|uniref:USP domain-containing protein n=1 Tax=Pythium insidiosum TaxID=114742 RepID=A0AAD5QB42_PYTIN|nr:hypothetical protein P43SY_008666 [Pythium insidiosum]